MEMTLSRCCNLEVVKDESVETCSFCGREVCDACLDTGVTISEVHDKYGAVVDEYERTCYCQLA